jgi:membrane-bound lytic murein transglycosylase A
MNTASPRASAISSKITHIARSASAWLASIVLGACAPLAPVPKPAPEAAHYRPMSFDALPGWPGVSPAQSLRAFLAGCPRLGATALAGACEQAAALADADERQAREFFEAHFIPYALGTPEGKDSGLITGYYEPVIEGNRTRDAIHRHPIYGVPPDLVVVELGTLYPELRHMRLRGRLEGRRLVPYYSRSEIASRGDILAAPVIAWASDPVELFFLHIQGSGQVRMEDGARIRVGYADQNGHPYRSLGRHLVERGELRLEDASMQGIKAWARANPERVEDALNRNASYVFFTEQRSEGGPLGALSVPLVAGYSIAIDRRHVPLGAPVYLSSTDPLTKAPLERLMAAHDTGGAIRGAVRADFFWGSGEEAGEFAGIMREHGRLWVLWPRGASPPRGD